MSGEWEKRPALDGRPNPCLCCPPIPSTLPLKAIIAVGFGDAHASCGGRVVYREPTSHVEADVPQVEYWNVWKVEKLAAADPDHDWQIVLFGPLHGEVYQRHGKREWSLIEKNQGFA